MNETTSHRTPSDDASLAHYAKWVVAATFLVIAVGGHTTTRGAGMAFPDWPLSHGSINPEGWLTDVLQRLEHGHRLIAQTVGLLIGILCAWVWRNKWALPAAIGVSVALAVGSNFAGAPREIVAHIGLWSSAGVFAAMILLQKRSESARSPAVRWLAFAAFVGVCIQAVMGGLRVTIETGGNMDSATIFRVLHGCFAQIELCLLVALATMLSPVWLRLSSRPEWRRVSLFAWITAGALFLQLIAGAAMRHLGAGLAIPTFPHASPDGSWLPHLNAGLVQLHFMHSRIGALLVTVLVSLLVITCWRRCRSDAHLMRPALLLAALVIVQVMLGMFVIWQLRPPGLTTLHVVNGAALLATTVLLAMRASRSPRRSSLAAKREPELAEVYS